MKGKGSKCIWSLYMIAMLILIFDSKTAIDSAKEGINLCLQSVVPSLFPFIFLSGMLTASLSDISIPGMQFLSHSLRIPHNSEMLVVLGFLGGYPVGAQNVCNAHRNKIIGSETARRMLIFCNNAGPAFIFGIVAPQLGSLSLGWFLWGIIILSSLITAALLPGNTQFTSKLDKSKCDASQILTNTLKSMSGICGWVVIFRVLLGVAEKWLLYRLSNLENILISGFLELTNGCVQLKNINNNFEQFAVSVVLLSFGGICVTMQTSTAAGSLGMRGYLPGKVLQCCIAYLLCFVFQPILFPGLMQMQHLIIGAIAVVIAVFCLIYFKYNKECSRFSKKSIVYCQHSL